MPKGGARARSGPRPDPGALRRERDAGDWIDLPAAGRQGKPPDWPLSSASQRELELWAEQWVRPQALMWEKQGQEIEVALFVRTLVDAERPGAPAAARNLLRQLMEGLALTGPGLDRAKWRIVDGPDVAGAKAPRPKRKTTNSVRDRLKVVRDGEDS